MKLLSRRLAPIAVGAALAFASALAMAGEVVVKTAAFTPTPITLPYTTGFNDTVSAFASPFSTSDFFLGDYTFTVGSNASASSAVVTFNLSTFLGIDNLSMTLLTGSGYSGATPHLLTASETAARDASIFATSTTGSGGSQWINNAALAAGTYTLEVRGHVIDGAVGGSYGGVLNVAAVPEPTGGVLAMAGFGLLAFAKRRSSRSSSRSAA
jgi:hypothetical protein